MAIEFLTPPDLAALDACLILDASYYLDGGTAKARRQFAHGAIPGAKFWDINACADPHSTLPHMFAPDHVFAHFWAGTGWERGQPICVYDQLGLFSAPRLAWELSKRGVEDPIYLLAGGLPAWEAAGLATVPGTQVVAPAPPKTATPLPKPLRDVCPMSSIVEHLSLDPNLQIVDARPPGRFQGMDPEPRPGLRGGHIPGSLNLPYNAVVEEGRFSQTFDLGGVDLRRPLITTCGSGITAAGLALALERRGAASVRVFDGSWAQWGDPAAMTPIATGPAPVLAI